MLSHPPELALSANEGGEDCREAGVMQGCAPPGSRRRVCSAERGGWGGPSGTGERDKGFPLVIGYAEVVSEHSGDLAGRTTLACLDLPQHDMGDAEMLGKLVLG